ncbi:hypothetical protein D6C84_02406 [Aureobasidium pullulans]|uniref:Uncharacterized protein n=1 Tax=Aureobasidium pullulans TaxID=5580 RepID=A0A4S9Y1E0_AURPU|nr:hypothetical protein D6C84_02406 [Aureobasidium pullulans]
MTVATATIFMDASTWEIQIEFEWEHKLTLCSHAYTTKICTPKCDRRTYAMYDRIVVVGLYPQDTTSRDEWTVVTFMNSFNFDTYKWGGMDSSPLSHSAPLTANTWNGQDWQQLMRLGAGILAIHAV